MIKFFNDAAKERYRECVTFAKRHNCLNALKERIRYLSDYASDKENEIENLCLLGVDFAPLSFSFMILRKSESGEYNKLWFNGGLIYSGPGLPLDGSYPSFTVSLDPDDGKKHDWSIHT